MVTKRDKGTLSVIYQSHLVRYQVILDSDHSMDSKNGVLVGAILAIGVFIFQDNIFQSVLVNCSLKSHLLFTVLCIGTLLIVISLIIALVATWPRNYSLPSNTTEDYPDYIEKSEEGVTIQMIADIEYAMNIVESKLKQKSVLFRISLSLFVVATISLIVIKQVASI